MTATLIRSIYLHLAGVGHLAGNLPQDRKISREVSVAILRGVLLQGGLPPPSRRIAVVTFMEILQSLQNIAFDILRKSTIAGGGSAQLSIARAPRRTSLCGRGAGNGVDHYRLANYRLE